MPEQGSHPQTSPRSALTTHRGGINVRWQDIIGAIYGTRAKPAPTSIAATTAIAAASETSTRLTSTNVARRPGFGSTVFTVANVQSAAPIHEPEWTLADMPGGVLEGAP